MITDSSYLNKSRLARARLPFAHRLFSPRLWAGFWFVDPPHDASLDGHRIDEILRYLDGIVGLYFAVVALILILILARFRHGRNPRTNYTHGNSRRHIAFTAGLGLLVFFSIDAVIETMAFRDLREAFWNFPRGAQVVRVEAMAQQFAWNFRYPGPDGTFHTEDDVVPPPNQLHVPVGRPVVIQIASWDVIHSLFLPNFRVKVDATPGRINALWFQAQEAGKFEIACAELCGNSHYRMRGFLTTETSEAFNSWLEETAAAVEEGEEEWAEGPEEPKTRLPANWGWPWNEVSR